MALFVAEVEMFLRKGILDMRRDFSWSGCCEVGYGDRIESEDFEASRTVDDFMSPKYCSVKRTASM